MFKMFSCKDISKVACHCDELGFVEKINYKIHLMMCGNCRKYVHGIELIGMKFSEILKRKRNVSPEKVTELENRILESVKRKSGSE